jgi:hypothetical protein
LFSDTVCRRDRPRRSRPSASERFRSHPQALS